LGRIDEQVGRMKRFYDQELDEAIKEVFINQDIKGNVAQLLKQDV
jgi:hypothetical protein